MKNIIHVAQLFEIGEVLNVSEYGSGIINETYLVKIRSGQKLYIHQINRW